jgi:hypothetical protein
VDQAIVQAAKRRSIDAQPLGHPGPEAFDGNVGGLCQRMYNLAPLFRFHVDCDASFVSVGAEKDRAEARRRKWRPAARFVALADGFYLDDVGTEITEILGAQWASQDLRQVEDAYASQGF